MKHKCIIAGARGGVKKMIIVFTDGHSQYSPEEMALRLKDEGVETFAISLTPAPYADEGELLSITQKADHIFTPTNLKVFDKNSLNMNTVGVAGLLTARFMLLKEV